MIRVKNVSKTFYNRDGSKVRALRNIDLELDDTGITFICGASGNGKSTLLSIIAGLERFDSGDVVIDGESFKDFTNKDFDDYRRDHIGFVFEDYNLIETMNIKENIKLGTLANGSVPTDEQIADVLKKVKLSGFEERPISQCSSGQRQRVCIARTLIKTPKILFMDEPTAHLDDKNKTIIWDLVKEISKNCLIISVSHDSAVVEKYADRIITLENNTVGGDVRRKKEKTAEKAKAEDKKVEKPEEAPAKKHGLGYKYSFRLALNSLLYRRWRTVFMVILCTLAVSFFGIFAILGNFNSTYAQVNSLFRSKNVSVAPYVLFEKNGDEYSEINLTNGSYDRTQIESVLGNDENAVPYYEFQKARLSIGFNVDEDINPMTLEHSELTVTSIIRTNGDVPVNTNMFGQEILYGTYPQGANDGVVISDYMLGLIRLYGLQKGIGDRWVGEIAIEPEGRTLTEKWTDHYIGENIVGHSITLDGISYRICGIYDTDYETYASASNLIYYNTQISKDMYRYNQNNVYLTIHTSKDFEIPKAVTTGIAVGLNGYSASNNTELQNIVNGFSKKGFALSSIISSTVGNMAKSIEIYKGVSILLGCFSAFFAIVMMYYFINQIIIDRKNDVGVLKALGFSNWNISSIFLQSTSMFVVLSFIVTLIITELASVIANSLVGGSTFIKFNLMSSNFGAVLLMFGVCVLIAVIGAIIPLINFAKKKPNEILKGFR